MLRWDDGDRRANFFSKNGILADLRGIERHRRRTGDLDLELRDQDHFQGPMASLGGEGGKKNTGIDQSLRRALSGAGFPHPGNVEPVILISTFPSQRLER